jgi:hypothetical protein
VVEPGSAHRIASTWHAIALVTCGSCRGDCAFLVLLGSSTVIRFGMFPVRAVSADYLVPFLSWWEWLYMVSFSVSDRKQTARQPQHTQWGWLLKSSHDIHQDLWISCNIEVGRKCCREGEEALSIWNCNEGQGNATFSAYFGTFLGVLCCAVGADSQGKYVRS